MFILSVFHKSKQNQLVFQIISHMSFFD